jgi:predicted ATPase/DNA-binding winged helix-turn-helix (wHTH) protein
MPPDQFRSPKAITIRFEPFELNVLERSLKKSGEAVPLGGRAFDLLVALIERCGETVGKNELIARVWPDVTVEEGALRVHMSALRKALGDRQVGQSYIANVQGRGYRFVAPVTHQAPENETCNTLARRSSLPAALGRMIGRDEEVLEVRALLRTERLITILGTGGIGKTTVALAIGHTAIADFSEAVYFVDLSIVTDREQLLEAVASALELAEWHADPEDALHDVMGRRKGLIILDSCEHLIDETSALAGCLLRRCPETRILATSREALQIIGERVFRLLPLACPPGQPVPTVDQARSYPAVQLFVERASACGTDFRLSDGDASAVTEICRRLDGVPLAIELAARRAALFGLKDTAARLGSRLDVFKFGRRTANPRHRTLRDTLDWSHDNLSEVERMVLRRLAIFIESFTLDTAIAIVGEDAMNQNDLAEAIESLVDKSMVEAGMDTHETSYRLLETTRSYALEKLLHSGEHGAIAARHANFFIKLSEENSVDPFEIQSSAPDSAVTGHAIGKRDDRRSVPTSPLFARAERSDEIICCGA